MRRIAVALIIPAALQLAACGSSATSVSTSATAAPSTTSVDAPAATASAPAGLSCADIGGVFVVHGTDGRGDCEPADQRPHCHVAPQLQDDNYVPVFVLDPPFPQGTVSAAEVQTALSAASNADCWKMPAGQ
ncbi:hypothetical protein ABIA39_007440 [Nocardia sp. GAS34]|uniref:hypothetical protein n=1 Tax=unclassified Nocardia TaxID=2637762 RepID=UPI003D1E14DE